MMSTNDLLSALCDTLDVPESYYEQARERYKSIAAHLERRESELARWRPHISPQGSFRYGTVVKPITADGEYDLDLVCELVEQTKNGTTQKALKESTGRELAAYATAHSMDRVPEEGRKCWHLHYADQIKFHIDVLPAVPEDLETKRRLALAISDVDPTGVLATLAIAITDNQSKQYGVVPSTWPSSNPRGLGRWFAERMRAVAEARMKALVQAGKYRTIDDVPVYTWKTPLQRSVQILKRHRDVMFREDCNNRPISMILTTLAARAYEGESTIGTALPAIVRRLPGLVRPNTPRVPNPVNPTEDFADKWASGPQLEQAFWAWIKQLQRDLDRLSTGLGADDLQELLETRFAVQLPDERLRAIAPVATAVAVPRVQIVERPRPWRRGA